MIALFALAVVALVAIASGALAIWGAEDAPEHERSQVRRDAADVTIASTLPVVEPKPRRLTISVSGDILIHSPLWQRALGNGDGSYDFAPMFRRIRRRIERADLAVCHLETPLTRGEPTSYPVFATPAALAGAITDTGWDACSTASNHSVDGGLEGIAETVAILDRAGLRHTGTYASPAASRRPLILRAHGVRVAWLSYTSATNGLPVAEPWSVGIADLEDPANVIADARAARRAGADAVIVNLHWGTEYAYEPKAEQKVYAKRLTRSEAITAVVGQGPHVVEPIEWRHGKPVVFSEGNLVSNQTAGCCDVATQDGLIAELELVADGDRVRVERVRYMPIWVRHPDFVVLQAGAEAGADAAALRAAYERTVATVGRDNRTIPVPRRLGG